MSERTTVVVEFPIQKKPDREEMTAILHMGFQKCQEKIGPGKILGVTDMAMAEAKVTGQPVFLMRFAVDAPEALQTK